MSDRILTTDDPRVEAFMRELGVDLSQPVTRVILDFDWQSMLVKIHVYRLLTNLPSLKGSPEIVEHAD